MKHLIWAFLLLSFSSSAQNWSLISSGKYLNYNKAGQTLVDGTLRVGSAYAEGVDSVFILLPKRGKYYPSVPYFEAVGHILGDTTFVHPGGIYEFRFNDSYEPQPTTEVRTQAKSGEAWTYQPGIVATVAEVKDTMIWGQNDSLKIIQLSDGRSFRLSKNFGLIAYDGLVLSGLQGQEIGTQLPTMDEWYGDWQPGAVFETYGSTTTDYVNQTFGWGKLYVTGRFINNDTLKVTGRRLTRSGSSFNGLPGAVTFSDEQITIVIGKADAVFYPGAESGSYTTEYSLVNGVISLNNRRVVTPISGSPISDKTYLLGKGLTNEQFAYGSIGSTYSRTLSLIGSQLPGQTPEGTIHPDSFFGVATDVNEQADDLPIKIFPNPSSDGWIQVARSSDDPLDNIQLMNLNGQVMREWANACSNCRLDLNNLTSGVYLLRLQTKAGEHISQKLLVRQ
ncbi:MAG: T9SS type A sorting domain-containing protein [Saprospiraceae bacterium]|nr:T9SS type A sorting domain-containing protein [Saprospiraceae bacterium]